MDKKNLMSKIRGFHGITLFDGLGKLDKRWYIRIYVSGNPKPQRLYLNRGKTAEERYQLASDLIDEHLAKMTEAGEEIEPVPISYQELSEKATQYADYCKRRFKQRTWEAYKSKVAYLCAWVKQNKLKGINKTKLRQFFDHLDEKGLANKTFNCYKIDLTAFLKWAFPQFTNPLCDVKMRRDNSEPYMYFTKSEMRMLMNEIKPENPQLWLCCEFTYYCLLRENEVRNLKVRHIVLEENRILIPASNSKNNRFRSIIFSDDFKKILENLELWRYNRDDYVISKTGFPSAQQVSRDWITREHLVYLKRLGFDTAVYKHYSYKNSGIKNMIEAGTPIKVVSLIAGHATIQQTERYIRHWNLAPDNASLIKTVIF